MEGALPNKKDQKKFIIYGIVSVILLTATSLLAWGENNSIDTIYYLAFFITLGWGILHVWLLYRLLLPFVPGEFWKGFLVTFLLMLLGAAGAALTYYFLHLSYSFLTFLAAFIIPYLSWKAYRSFVEIPFRVYKPWFYPLNTDMPDLDMVDLSQILVISFEFSKKAEDREMTNFTSKAPVNMTLGQLFFIFINDYNERNSQSQIGFVTVQQAPHGWFFFRRKGWLKRRQFFDPDITIRENMVKHNEIIFAQRLA